MKTFYLYSLFVAMTLNQVQAGSDSGSPSTSESPPQPVQDLDKHDCDPLAANTSFDPRRENEDAENQVFPVKEFLRYTMSNHYVARATPVPIESTGPTSPRWCHVPFFNKDCGPLHYGQTIIGKYDPNRDNGLKNIRMKTTFVAMNLENGKAMLYNMTVEGINEDDYIFKWVEDTPITVYEIGDDGNKKQIEDIPEDVLNRLKSEFAINRVGLTEPDSKEGEDDRSEYDEDDNQEESSPAGEGTSQTKDVEKKSDSPGDGKFDEFAMENRQYMIYVSCDGQSAWAAFNRSTVNRNEEAIYAEAMDRQIRELLDLVFLEKKIFPLVKSVSTYMPERFDQYIPKGPETNAEVPVSA